jgi:DNA mismatch repair ATPase MutS
MVNSDEGKFNFLFTLAEGYCPEDRYGIKLAKMIGIPDEICLGSEEIAEKIEKNLKIKIVQKNCHSISRQLTSLKYSTLDFSSLKEVLKKLKELE